MSQLRNKLRRQVKQADHLLEWVMNYLKVVGSFYLDAEPDLAKQFMLLYSATEELRNALQGLEKEM